MVEKSVVKAKTAHVHGLQFSDLIMSDLQKRLLTDEVASPVFVIDPNIVLRDL